MDDITKAHEFSSNNYEELKDDTLCGCFYCGKMFAPEKINDWTDGGKTALCPYCEINSVIGKNTGYPITEEFLEEMRKYWF